MNSLFSARARYKIDYEGVRQLWRMDINFLENIKRPMFPTEEKAWYSFHHRNDNQKPMMPAFWYKAVAEHRANKVRAALKPHDCPYCNGNQGGNDDCQMCQGTGINPDFIQWDKERLF